MNPALKALCDEYWEDNLEAHPLEATALGDHRYDDRLPDLAPAARERWVGRLESILDRTKDLDPEGLEAGDRITREALIEEVSGQLDELDCRLDDWLVDPLNGPQVEFLSLVEYTRLETPDDASRYIRRCRAMAPYLDQLILNLKAGLALNRTAPRAAVLKVIDQLERMEKEPLAASRLLKPLADPRPGWPGDGAPLRQELIGVLGEIVRPAFRRYLDFLKTQILPAARPDESAGLGYIPGGDGCYLKLIHVRTSLDLSPEDLHQLGLAEIARIRKEISQIGAGLFGTSDFDAIREKMRSDPAMYFSNGPEILDKAAGTLERARAALPRAFSVLPKTACEVKEMEMYEAPQSYVGYYREPAADGSRPGYYMVNTFKPETRTRYEAEALAFHESIPGHHLQIARNQEMTDLPAFRRFHGVTAFVEGWALYAEVLADEMGLYSGDLDRLGRLSYDAWRASRLVVDTGLHAMGWSRDEAVRYMMDNTLLAPNNIENEVDRYLVMPGQALAYKVGQLEILKLRDEARKALGDRFDLKTFHEALLRNGAVALPVLRGQIEALIAAGGRN